MCLKSIRSALSAGENGVRNDPWPAFGPAHLSGGDKVGVSLPLRFDGLVFGLQSEGVQDSSAKVSLDLGLGA